MANSTPARLSDGANQARMIREIAASQARLCQGLGEIEAAHDAVACVDRRAADKLPGEAAIPETVCGVANAIRAVACALYCRGQEFGEEISRLRDITAMAAGAYKTDGGVS